MARRSILFTGHDFRFVRPLIQYCEASPAYTVLLDEHPGHVVSNPAHAEACLAKADLIFCEWCLGNAVWYSRRKRPDQRLVVRLHQQEMGLAFLGEIAWDVVDALVLICHKNQRLILERFPFLSDRTVLIYNPIDCDRLSQPKLPGSPFNLGLMGTSPKRKAPHVALDIFDRLRSRDGRFTLYIKGRHPWEYDWLWRKADEKQYYQDLYKRIDASPHRDSIVFETYGEDIADWFTKIGFILSTSEFEGSHQAVAEGMASGALPIIRDWDGASDLYPASYIFSTTEQAADLVTGLLSNAAWEESIACVQRYARSHFHHVKIMAQYENLFERLNRKCPPQGR